MLCTAFVSAVLAIKIVAAHLYKTIDSYLDKHDAQIMDLIKWQRRMKIEQVFNVCSVDSQRN